MDYLIIMGKILMKGTETELPLAINEFENSMSGWRSYGSLFRCDGGFYNVETGQIISPDFPHGLEWFGEADHANICWPEMMVGI